MEISTEPLSEDDRKTRGAKWGCIFGEVVLDVFGGLFWFVFVLFLVFGLVCLCGWLVVIPFALLESLQSSGCFCAGYLGQSLAYAGWWVVFDMRDPSKITTPSIETKNAKGALSSDSFKQQWTRWQLSLLVFGCVWVVEAAEILYEQSPDTSGCQDEFWLRRIWSRVFRSGLWCFGCFSGMYWSCFTWTTRSLDQKHETKQPTKAQIYISANQPIN